MFVECEDKIKSIKTISPSRKNYNKDWIMAKILKSYHSKQYFNGIELAVMEESMNIAFKELVLLFDS